MRVALILLLLTFVSSASAQKTVPIGDAKPPAEPLPKLIRLLRPDYPNDAADVTLHSEILITIKVDKDNKLSIVDVSGPMAPCSDRGDKRVKKLREAALEAVKKSSFEAAIQDGKPVDSFGTIKYQIPPPAASEPSTGEPKMIQGGVINGKALSLPRPAYPPLAHASRAAGAVSVQVVIGEDGKVLGAMSLSGHPDLKDAAVEAACDARFSPTLLAGHPVKVTGVITYNFIP